MQVACTWTPEGRVYRFYRSSEDFARALKPLVPLLLASQADVVIGNEDGDLGLLLRVGPIAGEHEALLLSLIGGKLVCRCEPA